MSVLTKQWIATFFLVILLLAVTLKDIQLSTGLSVSFYRVISMPVAFLLLLFSLREGVKGIRLQAPTLVISLLFVIWTLFTCLFSRDLQESTRAWLQFIFQYFLMSFITALCIKMAWSKRLFVIIAIVMQLAGFIISASIFLCFFFGIGYRVEPGRTIFTDTPSLLGGSFFTIVKLVIALSMSIFLFLHYKSIRQNLRSMFSLLAVIIFLAAFFISGSRTGMGIALFIMLIIVVKSRHDLMKRKPMVFMAVASGVLVLSIVSGLFFLGKLAIDPDSKWFEVIYDYVSFYKQIKTRHLIEGSSLEHRLHLFFVDAPRVFDEQCTRRLAFGVGLEQFPKYTDSRICAENAYLSSFVETGLIGGLLFLALVVQLGRTFYKQWRMAGSDSFELYLFIAFLGMALFFIFEPTLRASLIWRFYIPLALFFESRQLNVITSGHYIQSLNSRQIKV